MFSYAIRTSFAVHANRNAKTRHTVRQNLDLLIGQVICSAVTRPYRMLLSAPTGQSELQIGFSQWGWVIPNQNPSRLELQSNSSFYGYQ